MRSNLKSGLANNSSVIWMLTYFILCQHGYNYQFVCQDYINKLLYLVLSKDISNMPALLTIHQQTQKFKSLLRPKNIFEGKLRVDPGAGYSCYSYPWSGPILIQEYFECQMWFSYLITACHHVIVDTKAQKSWATIVRNTYLFSFLEIFLSFTPRLLFVSKDFWV